MAAELRPPDRSVPPGSLFPPEPEGGWFTRDRVMVLLLALGTIVALYLCYRIVEPFLAALAWALALAIISHPLHLGIVRYVHQPTLAAAITILLVVVVIIIPMFLVTQGVMNEIAAGIAAIREEARTGSIREGLLSHPTLAPLIRWLEERIDIGAQIERMAASAGGRIPAFVIGSFWSMVQFLVTFFVLFYFLRDRRKVLHALRGFLPLSSDEASQLFQRVSDTIYATLYGTILVALVQGALGGLMFWWLGLPGPLLWGLVMALLAVIPIFGAYFIWIPAVVWLLTQGEWGKALLLAVWGSVVIGLIDNLLYPVLVGKRMRLHTLPVFFAVVGGIAFFGTSGLILGPVVLALTDALLHFWSRRTAGGAAAEEGMDG